MSLWSWSTTERFKQPPLSRRRGHRNLECAPSLSAVPNSWCELDVGKPIRQKPKRKKKYRSKICLSKAHCFFFFDFDKLDAGVGVAPLATVTERLFPFMIISIPATFKLEFSHTDALLLLFFCPWPSLSKVAFFLLGCAAHRAGK